MLMKTCRENYFFDYTFSKKSQIWVETALYTLIGLTLITIILSITIPQITKIKERSIIRQSINSLDALHREILEVSDVAGNIRVIFLKSDKGTFEIDPVQDKITFILENSPLQFSEPGQKIKYGEIFIETVAVGKRYTIRLELDYASTFDITADGGDGIKVIHGGTNRLKVENVGDNHIGEKVHLDFDIV